MNRRSLVSRYVVAVGAWAVVASATPIDGRGPGSEAPFEIVGTIRGITNRTVVLKTGYGPEFASTRSVSSPAGEFRFTGVLTEPSIAQINVDGEKKGLAFVLEPGRTEITLDIANLNNGRAVAGPENRAYQDYMTAYADLNARNGETIAAMNRAKKAGDDAAYADAERRWNTLGGEFESTLSGYITKYSTRYVALHIIRMSTMSAPDLAMKWLPLVDRSLREHPVYKEISQRATSAIATAIGKPAPAFSQPLASGGAFSLESLRGKIVLVDFWASWCGPCRKENPNLLRIYERFKDRGFEIVSVSLDEDRDLWLKAVGDDRLSWTQVSDLLGWKNSAAVAYGIGAVPANFLVGRDGAIIGRNLIGQTLESKVAEVLR